MNGNGSAAVVGGVGCPPFTVAQRQDLQHLATIFNYLNEGIPVPPELLPPIHSSPAGFIHYSSHDLFDFATHFTVGYYSFYGKKIDPEPGRCRRTDGKKWRCSKDAHQDSKYCERHMNSGRYRSRKHVESKAASQAVSTMKLGVTSGSGRGSGGISFQSLPHCSLASTSTIGFGISLSPSLVESSCGNTSKYSEMKSDATTRSLDSNSVMGSCNFSLSRGASGHIFSGNSSPLYSRYISLQKLQELDHASCHKSKQHRQSTLFDIEFSPWEPAKQPVEDFLYEWSDQREKNFFLDNQSYDQGAFSSVEVATHSGKDPCGILSTHA